jgi:hypothetical protein
LPKTSTWSHTVFGSHFRMFGEFFLKFFSVDDACPIIMYFMPVGPKNDELACSLGKHQKAIFLVFRPLYKLHTIYI